MSVEMLDGDTIRRFVDDERAFNASIDRRFASLDANHDGKLSYVEMAKELRSMRVFEVHFGVDGVAMSPDELIKFYLDLFERFDRDGDGSVSLEDFRAEMKEVLLAVAAGIGFLPVQMLVEEGSFLKMVVDNEAAAL